MYGTLYSVTSIDHFTVVFLVTWPLNGNEAEGDLVLIQTSLLLLCKSSCSYANYLAFTWEKQRGLYQNKVISSLACIHGQVTKHTTVKWPIWAHHWSHRMIYLSSVVWEVSVQSELCNLLPHFIVHVAVLISFFVGDVHAVSSILG